MSRRNRTRTQIMSPTLTTRVHSRGPEIDIAVKRVEIEIAAMVIGIEQKEQVDLIHMIAIGDEVADDVDIVDKVEKFKRLMDLK